MELSPMNDQTTLCELLTEAAARKSGGYFFHSGGDPVALPVAHLYARALRRAAQLGLAGITKGNMVGLLGTNAPEWVEWAWGTWLAGAVLVPLPAPVRVRHPATFSSQVASLAGATGCRVIVGQSRYLDLLGPGAGPKLDWANEPPLAPGPRADLVPPTDLAPTDLAMVLCTSGSTATPKGVRMTHARAVVWARTNAAKGPPGTVPATVSWLPFFHIGGLGALFEVASPANRHFLPMERFVRDPPEWLRLTGRTGAAFTVGPSSAWAAAVRGLAKRPDGVDLSGLKAAVFNAEVVDADVVGRTAEVCGPLGLAPGSIGVHYASSEAGMISRAEPGQDLRVDVVDLDELSRSARALPARGSRPAKRVVSCGTPYPGVEVRVGHPDRPCPDRHLGEVWVRGPGVTDGYVNTRAEGSFAEGFFRPGDLGYMAEGELFLTGRANEVIVRLGQKYHPEDIEQAVQRATGLPPGSCAAFSPLEGRPGDLVVVVEEATGGDDLAGAVAAAIVNAVGLAPAHVLVVPTGSLPTTPNGKLQRGRAREMHRQGEFSSYVPEAAPFGPSPRANH
ncbi:MAG: AMP-binding protein [Acidimicrobiales bacterium]